MTDTDQGPDALDVLEHAMLDDFDPKLYDGSVLIEGREGTPFHKPSIEEVQENVKSFFLRCFVGEAIIRRIDDIPYPSYRAVARAYNVSPHLVHAIGEGVVNLTFDEGVRFVKTAIRVYRANPGKYDDDAYAGFGNWELRSDIDHAFHALENDAAGSGNRADATT